MPDKKHGEAYHAVHHVYDKSPGRSWQRLNGALFGTLRAAIEAHLSFQSDDFAEMYKLGGNYWMGNSEGNVCGERFYTLAVKYGHTSACMSFEKYANRPPALWPEQVRTPARLCIGSDFVWDGLKVTVTNMREDHIIACSYKAYNSCEFEVGNVCWVGSEYRTVNEILSDGDGILVRYGKIVPSDDLRKVDRRFKIAYTELSVKRREYDQRKKELLKAIEEATETQVVDQIRVDKFNPHLFRPFDIVEIRKAFDAKYEKVPSYATL